MHIGLKIKALRNDKLLTQAQLAELSGLSTRTIRRLESSENVHNATLLAVLDALDTDLNELEKTFKENSTTENTVAKNSNETLLLRITSGKELSRIIENVHQYGYDYYDCHTERELKIIQEFLTITTDVGDLWGMLELGERFELENELSKQIKLLEANDFWIFGARKTEKAGNVTTAVLVIYSKDNPLIQKINLEEV